MGKWVWALCLWLACGAAAGAQERGALWTVVQACRANHDLTGAAFPCLQVNVAEGVARGYVVLRPPLGSHDFILSPTRRIVGVEDPSLAAPDAPNYFEAAWNARGILAADGGAAPDWGDVGLAVNSRFARSQDQLHIHIGCLRAGVKSWIAGIAPGLSSTRWRSLRARPGGGALWARRINGATLAGANPFRLIWEGLPLEGAGRPDVSLVVAGIRPARGREGFVALAGVNSRAGSDWLADACP